MSMNQHILVVEDEDHLAIGIRYNLEAEGFRVTAVGDGPAALLRAEDTSDPVDLIILDLMLPGMDGFEVLKRLRADGVETPVLCLTARGLEQDRVQGLELGADDYVVKPFGLKELLARSARTTHRVVIVEEGHRFAGVGAQIADDIYSHCFDDLDAPIVRVTHTENPLPYAKNLEPASLPQIGDIIEAAKSVMYRT